MRMLGEERKIVATIDGPGSVDTGLHRMVIGDLEIRPEERQVLINGARVGLTRRECEILVMLVSHFDRVLPRDMIFDEIWGGRMSSRDRSVDVYVRRVREKLRKIAPDSTYIHTHFGIGYRFYVE